MMDWNHWDMGFNWIGFPFMILFWGLIIWLVIVLIQKLYNQDNLRENKDSALDILRRRYAKGEIDKQEFEEKKNDLV